MKTRCVQTVRINWILTGLFFGVQVLLLLGLMGFLVSLARADEVKMPSDSTLKVIVEVANKSNVDAQALIKIAFVESGFKTDARRVNRNGTVDVGMFQINSVHWTTSCRGLDVFTLRGNATCAARLLKRAERHRSTDPHWTGRYHSKTPALKRAYSVRLAEIDLVVD